MARLWLRGSGGRLNGLVVTGGWAPKCSAATAGAPDLLRPNSRAEDFKNQELVAVSVPIVGPGCVPPAGAGYMKGKVE